MSAGKPDGKLWTVSSGRIRCPRCPRLHLVARRMNLNSGRIPSVERIDDVVELTYSALVVSDREESSETQRDTTFDQQFFVDWEVPQA